MILKVTDLHYKSGGSDKVYHVALEELSTSTGKGYNVLFCYGRRGSANTRGTKNSMILPRIEVAEKLYLALISEKTAKGYKLAPGISGDVFGAGLAHDVDVDAEISKGFGGPEKEQTELLPQLCNPCTDEQLEELLADTGWGMQEKIDGKRMILMVQRGDRVTGINRKGQVIMVPPQIAKDLTVNDYYCVLDGELVGEKYYAFSRLDPDSGADFMDNMKELLVRKSVLERDIFLQKLFESAKFLMITRVPMYITESEKRLMLMNFRLGRKEGVVFKRLASYHSAGRPSSGGDYFKYKFWTDGSFIVNNVNVTRSVELKLWDGTVVGNVTIPPNFDIPTTGQVVDVKYLYAYKGGSLYQPIYRGVRDDVTPIECTAEKQLKFKAEEE